MHFYPDAIIIIQSFQLFSENIVLIIIVTHNISPVMYSGCRRHSDPLHTTYLKRLADAVADKGAIAVLN